MAGTGSTVPDSDQKILASKGKGIDPCEWGNLSIDEEELNPRAQNKQYEYLQWLNIPSPENSTSHFLSSEPSTPETEDRVQQMSAVNAGPTSGLVLSSSVMVSSV